MSADFTQPLIAAWASQRDYADRLTSDLSPELVFQTPPGGAVMNHPAWVLCHLTAYAPILGAMLRGESPDDPLDHPYGKQSTPTLDQGAYPAWETVRADYLSTHDLVPGALEFARSDTLNAPPSIVRFRDRWSALSGVVVHLMIHHECVHLGQLSAWRRACGLASV